MSQAAQAHDSWADIPTPRPRRREADSWASADELEILGGLGEERVADWTVLTLERDDEADAAEGDLLVSGDVAHLDGAPRAPRRGLRGRMSSRLGEDVATDPADLLADPAAATTERMTLAPARDHERGLPRAQRPRRVSGPAAGAGSTFFDAPGTDDDGRQAIVVRGQATPMRVPATDRERRRPATRTRDRVGHRPDRVAFWAVILGVLLILVAMSSAG